MEEQNSIVFQLEKIDALISLRKQQLSKLDEFVKSRFIELFGDPVLNQHGWRKAALEANATLLNGRAYKQDELLDSGKYPVLRVGNFFSNRGWYYSDLELDDDKYCDSGDLLYAWSASFGPQIWNGGKVIYHYHIWKVLVGEAYNKQFLCKLLEYATESLMGDTHGIAMMHLTKSGMEKTEFIVPPIELQEQFAAFVEQIDKSKFEIQQSLEKLETLKKALMQKYFN
jgi:type I restriction enzyme S subunit